MADNRLMQRLRELGKKSLAEAGRAQQYWRAGNYWQAMRICLIGERTGTFWRYYFAVALVLLGAALLYIIL